MVDQFLLNNVSIFLNNGEDGILNLICRKYYNHKFKLNIDGLIYDGYMAN